MRDKRRSPVLRMEERPDLAVPYEHASTARSQAAVANLMRLQAVAGNRAVSQLVGGRMLSRTPKRAVPTMPPMPIKAKGSGAAPTPSKRLSPEDRMLLAKQASGRIGTAWTAFSGAVRDHIASIKAEDKAKAEMLAAVVEIFVGFAAPFLANLGKGLGTPDARVASKLEKVGQRLGGVIKGDPVKTAASKRWTVEADAHAKRADALRKHGDLARNKRDEWQKRKATLKGKDQATAEKAVTEWGKNVEKADKAANEALKAASKARLKAEALATESTAPALSLLTDQEILKQTWTSVGSIAKVKIKLDPLLYGEGKVDVFARMLLDGFHAGVNELRDDLAKEGIPGKSSKLSDEELIALWAAFQDEFTDSSAYVEQLKDVFSKFKTYVRPIDVKEVDLYGRLRGTWKRSTMAVWITGYGAKRLALVNAFEWAGQPNRPPPSGNQDMTPKIQFLHWVPPDMAAAVYNTSARMHPRGPNPAFWGKDVVPQLDVLDIQKYGGSVPTPPGYWGEKDTRPPPAPPPKHGGPQAA